VLAKLRSGVLPLEIETGRWRGVPADERLCMLCNDGSVEDEYHFVLECDKYREKRIAFVNMIVNTFPDFNDVSPSEKWTILMCEAIVNHTARFVSEIYEIRNANLYMRG